MDTRIQPIIEVVGRIADFSNGGVAIIRRDGTIEYSNTVFASLKTPFWGVSEKNMLLFFEPLFARYFANAIDHNRGEATAFRVCIGAFVLEGEFLPLPDTDAVTHVALAVRDMSTKSASGSPMPTPALTRAETEVLALIKDGVSENKLLAKRRGVTVNTIKRQVSSILQKYDVSDKTALITKTLGNRAS